MAADSEFSLLFRKYVDGTASHDERLMFLRLADQEDLQTELAHLVDTELKSRNALYSLDEDEQQEILSNIYKAAPVKAPAKKTTLLRPRVRISPGIAAGIAAMVTLVIFCAYLFSNRNKANDYVHLTANDIAPGKVGATLTLADGKKIKLSDAANGEIAKESGISISKTADGQIVYEMKSAGAEAGKSNTLSTEKGETYIVTLPDKSKVWLNAASSLTFNTALITEGVRQVKLKGEAYFEVAKDKAHPFIVESGSQQVTVLGTHFNVNAYQDEHIYKTTLLEGSIKLTDNGQTKVLTPGTQATNSGGNISLGTADTELAVAWKSNNFTFDRLDIKEIMRMIERWYDVEVIYKDDISSSTFWGSVSRFDNISKVLIPLEATGDVHFKIEGRKIYVSR